MFRKRNNSTLKSKLVEAGVCFDGSWPSDFLLDLLNKYGIEDFEDLVIQNRSRLAVNNSTYNTIYILKDGENIVEINAAKLIRNYLGNGGTLVWEIGITSPEDSEGWDEYSYISKYDVTGKKVI